MVALRALAAREAPGLALSSALPEAPSSRHMTARIEKNVKANYAPPDLKALAHFGRGLSAAQSAALQQTRQALILSFTHPKKHTLQGLRSAYVLAHQAALRTGGLLWDDETREVFTPQAWHERRLASWSEAWPEVHRHITIHSYQSGTLVRAISLGMSKFGQPDLIVDQFPWSSSQGMGNVINLLAQTLVEGAEVGRNGRVDLDIANLKNAAMRKSEIASYRENATGRASLALVKGTWEEGDPHNRLAEITFSLHKAPDLHARQDAVGTSLWGSSSKVQYIRHDAELKAASALARKKLPALLADFARGLRPGEYIEVKAPFATASGGREWMWVEIHTWKGKVIEGTLNNQPRDIPSLRSGQRVTVDQDDVFDYIRNFPGGSQEGNTTGVIIQKMQAAAPN